MDVSLMGREKISEPVLKTNIQLTNFVKLDNGTAYLGFTHETVGLVN